MAADTDPRPPDALPRFVRDGHGWRFLVDGEPFLLLGAQVHNSSAWPDDLENALSQLRELHANTLEAPVYWEEVEPERGRFDFTTVDRLVEEARKHDLRLVLLWFGTWKNGTMDYAPAWVKRAPETYPRMIGADGRPVRVLSPHSETNLEADRRAFVALMEHLKTIDGDRRTVILVQVENEPGSLFTVRDYAEEPTRLFEGDVPETLARALGRGTGTWRGLFSEKAEEAFSAFHVARFVDSVAEAGKEAYPLPMSVNVWLKERKSWERPGEQYPSGGATSDMLDLWKAAAPSIDVLAPDIYVLDAVGYGAVAAAYSRPDNPLLIPETGGDRSFARYFFRVLGDYGAVGFAPFGYNRLDGGRELVGRLEAMAANFRLIGPAARLISDLQAAGTLRGAAEEDRFSNQLLDFDGWQVLAQWGPSQLGYGGESAAGTPERSGRVLVGQMAADCFFVVGFDTRVRFRTPPGDGREAQFVRVEEGTFEDGEWIRHRLWNGDQAFFGLRLPSSGAMLKVELTAF